MIKSNIYIDGGNKEYFHYCLKGGTWNTFSTSGPGFWPMQCEHSFSCHDVCFVIYLFIYLFIYIRGEVRINFLPMIQSG